MQQEPRLRVRKYFVNRKRGHARAHETQGGQYTFSHRLLQKDELLRAESVWHIICVVFLA